MRTKIAADGGEDGDSFGPGHNTNIRAKSAISGVQGGAQEAAVRHRPAVPKSEMRERVGYRAAHQPDATPQPNETHAPLQPHPIALLCPP